MLYVAFILRLHIWVLYVLLGKQVHLTQLQTDPSLTLSVDYWPELCNRNMGIN